MRGRAIAFMKTPFFVSKEHKCGASAPGVCPLQKGHRWWSTKEARLGQQPTCLGDDSKARRPFVLCRIQSDGVGFSRNGHTHSISQDWTPSTA